jgi:uncharacterized protein YciI
VSNSSETEIATVPYHLVLLIPDRDHARAADHFASHVTFVEEMEAAGVVLLGGDLDAPVEGAEGAYLLHTPTRAEAEAWAARDPLVQHRAYRAHVVTWHLVGISTAAIDPALAKASEGVS